MYIDCKNIYESIKTEITKEVAAMETKPLLTIVQFGHHSDSDAYVKGIIKDCADVGAKTCIIKLSENISQSELAVLLSGIETISTGIILQLPVPNQISIYEIAKTIPFNKDIDGFKENTVYIPATAKGIIMLLDSLKIDYTGKNVVIIGRSKHIGRAVAKELLARNCTTSICHSYTKDVAEYTRKADIIITAVGEPNYITPNMITQGALIIDVGINFSNGKVCGDVEQSCAEIARVTPVPNGMGLMTRVALLNNLINAKKIIDGELKDED